MTPLPIRDHIAFYIAKLKLIGYTEKIQKLHGSLKDDVWSLTIMSIISTFIQLIQFLFYKIFINKNTYKL